MEYRFFDGEKELYIGYREVNGNEYNNGEVFFEGGWLYVCFKCPRCNWVIGHIETEIERPNMVISPMSESHNSTTIIADCERCKAYYEGDVHSGQGGLFVDMNFLPKHWKF